MKIISCAALVLVITASTSAFAAGGKPETAAKCPQSLCISNGVRHGYTEDQARKWCAKNARTLGENCAQK